MIYLAGPYTSETFEQHSFNIGRLLTYYIWLQKKNPSPIICPPLESAGFDKGLEDLKQVDWVGKCVELVKVSEIIQFVPGWKHSFGCRCEYEEAKKSDTAIKELEELPQEELREVSRNLIEIKDYNEFAKHGLGYIFWCL